MQDLKNGKKVKWREKKIKNLLLANSLHRLGEHKKANRVWWCCSSLTYLKNLETGEKNLHSADCCRERLCPICMWRKSLKIFHQVSKVMDRVQHKHKELVPIFLSLTLKNCTEQELSKVLDELFKGWKNFANHSKFVRIVKGWFRALEVTYDGDEFITKQRYNKAKNYYDSKDIQVGDKNPNFNTFHPHIHVILMVDKSYFKGKDYMHTTDWVKMWRTSMGLDYDPICDIRKVRNKKSKYKAVAEVAKYTLKDSDFLTDDDNLTDKLVSVLGSALKKRRLHAFGGLLKKVAKEIGAENPDEGNLIHIDDESFREDVATIIEIYRWDLGLKNYVKVEELNSEVMRE